MSQITSLESSALGNLAEKFLRFSAKKQSEQCKIGMEAALAMVEMLKLAEYVGQHPELTDELLPTINVVAEHLQIIIDTIIKAQQLNPESAEPAPVNLEYVTKDGIVQTTIYVDLGPTGDGRRYYVNIRNWPINLVRELVEFARKRLNTDQQTNDDEVAQTLISIGLRLPAGASSRASDILSVVALPRLAL